MVDPESREFLLCELEKIKTWENEQKDLWFWEKLGRLPFVMLDRLTPKFIQEKLGQVIDEIGGYIQSGGKYLINERDVYNKFDTHVNTLDDISKLPLYLMDEAAQEFKTTRTKIARLQGATTGIGGIFTLAIDIPVLLGLSLKTLQEISTCYGYDPKEKLERIFIIKSLQFASSDFVGKKAILEELASFHKGNQERNQMITQLQGWREVVMTYRDNFGWKKLFQMIPIAGILFGAFLNKSTIEEVSEAGIMLYRKRRIMERLQLNHN